MNFMKSMVLWGAAVLLTGCAALQPGYASRLRTATPSDAALLVTNERIVVLDVGNAEDFARAHLRNAILIPREELWQRLHELPSYPGVAVLVYDAKGDRAHGAGILVADETDDTVYELSGELEAWVRAGHPVVGSQTVARLDPSSLILIGGVMSYTRLTDAGFEKEVLGSDVPVLLQLSEPWCEACRAVEPTVDELALEYDGKVKVVKLNVADNLNVAQRLHIDVIPTLMFFNKSKAVDMMIGARPKEDIREGLEAMLDRPSELHVRGFH